MEPQQPQTTLAKTASKLVMDVVPPTARLAATAPPEKTNLPVAKTSVAKPKNKDVTMAIVATVVIVLGLAALAVVAYLKQK